MRILRLACALVAALVLGAFAVATANAAETLWRWLPGSVGETFTVKSGTVTFQFKGGATFNCTASEIALAGSELIKEGSTEGKDATLALAVLKITGCKALGSGIHSVGDSVETILLHLEIHNCLIKSGDFGLLIKVLETTIEGLIGASSFVLKGSFIGLVANSGANKYPLNIKQTAGAQEIEKCEGGEKDTLLASTNGGAFTQTALEVKEDTLSFDKTKDKEEELML